MRSFQKLALVFLTTFLVFPGCSGKKSGAAATPEVALQKMVDSAKNENWEGVYESLSKESTEKLEAILKGFIQMAVNMAKTNPEAAKYSKIKNLIEISNLSGKEFFVKLFQIEPATSKQFLSKVKDFEVLKSDIKRDKATLTIKSGGQEDTIPMIKEGGEWKINFASKMSQQMGGGEK